ncbi:YbhB/YbcL family Raf kinase inhibitor-like protein [Propionimicrobium sp. PCR01-08-3]|uniref:YbhB/YbcL family Raf kinase inhibitor-like protein n=1 Tax=Propionimicrobium sp. PCR01-08-3 TaxID=3052086 RepID=UPI00255C55A6|nr:YbhB/YbcL family Raf kinase inhibitor-like protein [Propionimicrobium sp. PCR01-08-3]WIY82935.1 YbhB/YbcL family Raf kinase inhibitor-like protein [Propionimicrobium sp. PCR01-08-3]
MEPDFLKLKLTSPDFDPEGRIPDEFTQFGKNLAPRLHVSGLPSDAVELVLIVHDPDAPSPHGFTHWTLYGLPATNGPIDASLGRPGPNDANSLGYVGPKPPAGHGDHHYFFFIYALSQPTTGEPSRHDFLEQYSDAVLVTSRLVGLYSR